MVTIYFTIAVVHGLASLYLQLYPDLVFGRLESKNYVVDHSIEIHLEMAKCLTQREKLSYWYAYFCAVQLACHFSLIYNYPIT